MERAISILRLIGGRSKRLSSAPRAIRYILNKEKVGTWPVFCQYLSETDPEHSWLAQNSIKANHNAEQARPYHHGVIIPAPLGDASPTPETFKDIFATIAAFFSDYPLLAAVHRDRPDRLHMHYLIHPRNIETDKCYQLSSKGLNELKCTLNQLFNEIEIAPIGAPDNKKPVSNEQEPSVLSSDSSYAETLFLPEYEKFPYITEYEALWPEPIYECNTEASNCVHNGLYPVSPDLQSFPILTNGLSHLGRPAPLVKPITLRTILDKEE